MNQRKNEIRVVYLGRFTEGDILSGPGKTAKRIFREHSKLSPTTFIQYFFDGRKYGLTKKLRGKESHLSAENSAIITAGVFEIYRILKKIRPDIIHIIAFERFAVTALLYAKMNGARVIYNSHGVIAYENRKYKSLPYFYRFKDSFCEKRFLRSADKSVFPSEITLDIAEEYYNIEESKAVILPNGIDEEFGLLQRRAAENNTLKAVFVYKNEFSRAGLELLSAALFKLRLELELYIISSENLELKMGNNITLKWIRFMPAKELAEFYADKDVFLSLGNYDTFSISTAEAMAAGLIPVITRQTGLSRYIENSYNGYVLGENDPALLCNALEMLGSSAPEEKYEISANARKIYDSLSWDKVYQMYAELYREVMI